MMSDVAIGGQIILGCSILIMGLLLCGYTINQQSNIKPALGALYVMLGLELMVLGTAMFVFSFIGERCC